MKFLHKPILIISCIVSFVLGAVAVYAAWNHNPQLAFHSDYHIDILGLFLIFSIWFSVFLAVTVAFLYAINATFVLSRKSKN